MNDTIKGKHPEREKSKDEKRSQKESEQIRPKTALRENVEAVVVALVLALLVRTFIFQAFKIPSGSMKDTLLVGDHILVNKFIFDEPIPKLGISLFPLQEPSRKDIIVFKFPKDPSRDFIKRCVAIENDVLEIRNRKTKINNQIVDDSDFTKYDDDPQQSFQDQYRASAERSIRDNVGPLRVPDDSYFMMGDNRLNSQDSRYWGFLNRKLIKGKAFLIYLSIDDQKAPFWKRIRWDRLFKRIR